MRTIVKINGRYIGYIKPYAGRWMAKPVSGKGKVFDQAKDATSYLVGAQ